MPEDVTAYLVHSVLVDKASPSISLEGAEIPEVGQVLLRAGRPGTGLREFQIDLDIAQVYWVGIYLGVGKADVENDAVTFDEGVQRLLNLIAVGQDAEETLKREVSDAIDQAKAVVEEAFAQVGGVPAPTSLYPRLDAIAEGNARRR